MKRKCAKCRTNCLSKERTVSDRPKVFALIHDDRFQERCNLYGIYTTREAAELALEKEVPEDDRANERIRIIEYELNRFVKEGHFGHFEMGDEE